MAAGSSLAASASQVKMSTRVSRSSLAKKLLPSGKS